MERLKVKAVFVLFLYLKLPSKSIFIDYRPLLYDNNIAGTAFYL